MKFIKKLAAALTAAFLAVTPISASAYDFAPSADTLMSGEEYLTDLIDEGDSREYKFTMAQEGILTIKFVTRAEHSALTVRDADGGMRYPLKWTSKAGRASAKHSGRMSFIWDEDNKYYSGTIKFLLEAGDYYITLYKETNGVGGEFSITPTFPTIPRKPGFDDADAVEVTDDEITASGRTDRVTGMTVTMTPGRSLDLAKVLGIDNVKDKYIRWYTSDRKIVSVSKKGILKANAVGVAVITVYVGEDKSYVLVTVAE